MVNYINKTTKFQEDVLCRLGAAHYDNSMVHAVSSDLCQIHSCYDKNRHSGINRRHENGLYLTVANNMSTCLSSSDPPVWTRCRLTDRPLSGQTAIVHIKGDNPLRLVYVIMNRMS